MTHPPTNAARHRPVPGRPRPCRAPVGHRPAPAAPRRLVALGARPGRGGLPHHQPAAAAADRRRRRLRGGRPAHRRALGPLVRRVPAARAGRAGAPGALPGAARLAGPGHARPARRCPELPLPGWAQGVRIGGPVTLEALLFALYDGLRLATLLICVGAANALASPGPAAADAARRALRGRAWRSSSRCRSRRNWSRTSSGCAPPGGCAGARTAGCGRCSASGLPVLESALERSVALAAAMDSRGYGRTAPVSAPARPGHRRAHPASACSASASASTACSRAGGGRLAAAGAAVAGLAASARRAGCSAAGAPSAPATGPTRGPAGVAGRRLGVWRSRRRDLAAAGTRIPARPSRRRPPGVPLPLGRWPRWPACCPPAPRRPHRPCRPARAPLPPPTPRPPGRPTARDPLRAGLGHLRRTPPDPPCAAST